jgi:DHA1 family multidrug resistance protein-like MFS transporter
MLLNPICLIADLYYAYIYGIIYVLIVTIPLLFASDPDDPTLFHYGWSKSIVPLSYVGLGVGFFSAAFTAAQAQNRIYAYLCGRNGDKGQPEYRVSRKTLFTRSLLLVSTDASVPDLAVPNHSLSSPKSG